MAPIDDKKIERTTAKRSVTIAAKRLEGAVEMEMESTKDMASKLDSTYCDFIAISTEYNELCNEVTDIDDSYLIVNNKNLDEYDSDVKKTYQNAISLYKDYVAKSKPRVPSLNSESLVHLKKRDIPKFSGKRKDWPEFKAIWEKIVVPSLLNQTALAAELKLACKGGIAYDEIETISAGSDGAYSLMWDALSQHYDNITLSVSSALDEIKDFKQVKSDDYQGLVQLIRKVESVYQQLKVLNQVHLVSNREVNHMISFFPSLIKKDWAECHFKLKTEQQLMSFESFHKFLSEQLKIAKHLADTQSTSRPQVIKSTKDSVHKTNYNAYSKFKVKCCIHNSVGHTTETCRQFISLGVAERRDLLQKKSLCFRCFGNHRRAVCKEDSPCKSCGRRSHHTLMCSPKGSNDSQSTHVDEQTVANPMNPVNWVEAPPFPDPSLNAQSNAAQGSSGLTMYAIYSAPVTSSKNDAIIFCDDGSDTSFISHNAVKKLKARHLENINVEIDTLAGTKSLSTNIYEVTIITCNGKKVPVIVTELPRLTGTVSELDQSVLSKIFPDYDISKMQRPSGSVDILIGGDYFGLHPKRELASDSSNLSIMQGELGICVQGSHPLLKETTERDHHIGYSVRMTKSSSFLLMTTKSNISHPEFTPDVLHGNCLRSDKVHDYTKDTSNSHPNHCDTGLKGSLEVPEVDSCILSIKFDQAGQDARLDRINCASHSCKVPLTDSFIMAENLGTEILPKCGGCKCGKCPIRGHTYSFKEEQELELINSNLTYDSENERWVTSYPWIVDPQLLPNNYNAALATLCNTEKRLLIDPNWGSKYTEQIHDMEDRGVARRLSEDEMNEWLGPVFYLSHLAVENPKSTSTPVRIVFNSSQLCKGVSLNAFLAKGPDSFKTNLLGMLLRFRERPIVLIGDIRKMYNSVFLDNLAQQTHRFLWRDLNVDRPPDIWCITRVNMGDKPAGAIAIEAKDRTADLFRHVHPKASDFIKDSSYVDDLVDSFDNVSTARDIAKGADEILAKGGFHIKDWMYGGKGVENASSVVQKVLGVNWVAAEDKLLFEVQLNFSVKRRNVRTGPNLLSCEVPHLLPNILTRRIVLQQVMAIFDPYGLLAPFALIAKMLLRETWTLKLQWDDPLPTSMHSRWIDFFIQLFETNKLKYDRCVTPEGAVGKPDLILFSDGSQVAYGCAAYIRWTLSDGTYFCKLLLAKCRIAPIRRISIPQMELNGAVLSKRCRKVIEKESRFTFGRIFQLVDSETVLAQIHKLSTRFHVYEGVRIGEIQAATDGNVREWGWIPSDKNIADWVSRSKPIVEIGPDSKWINGPDFLYKPLQDWGIQYKPSAHETLPGEKKVTVHSCSTVESPLDIKSICLRSSSLNTILWCFARILSILSARSFSGGKRQNVTLALLRNAEQILITKCQVEWTPVSVKNQFRSLQPIKQHGLWVVGTRISHQSPLSPENEPQILLPYSHPYTKLVMIDAHCKSGHRGRDATVARFRARFWTSHATKLSSSVCNDCQLCKLKNVKRLSQIMGQMPVSRLLPSPPFTAVMLDLFGPYHVRGEVQKRTTGKAWGVLFTDLCSRAVHIEVVFGYDTKSFLLALSRFAAIRGWPSVIYSDPGSQLVGASNDLARIWRSIDLDEIKQVSVDRGLEWKFGPADSPWYQGAAEALVKSAKRAIDLSVKGHRLSVSEIMTVFTQAADLLNERPLGIMPGSDSDISILTPNLLLLGRSCSVNQGGYDAQPSLKSRLTLVQSLVDQFWSHWCKLYAPTLVKQAKWLNEKRDLKEDDVVIIADSGIQKGKYKLGRITKVIPSADGRVRRVRVMFKRYKVGERLIEYSGSSNIEVERSIQHLALLVPVENS